MRRAMVLMAVAVAVSAHPAVAATGDEQTITDSCVSEFPTEQPQTNESYGETVVPWLDICSGDVTATADGGRLTSLSVVLHLDGDTALAAGGTYGAGWGLGDCSDRVRYVGAALPGDVPTLTFSSRCGAMGVPCDPKELEDVGFFCVDLGETTTVELAADSVRLDGPAVTIVLDPALLPGAGRYAPGATLRRPHASTSQRLGDEDAPADFATAEKDVIL